jgi:hypothetical protein
MRNDSRPIFEHSPASPLGGPDEHPEPSERADNRDSIPHGRESHIVHQVSEKNDPSRPNDPVTPSSTVRGRTKI